MEMIRDWSQLTVTSLTTRPRKNFKRHERKDQIERVVLEHLLLSQKAMSMRQIADKVGMAPTMHVTRLIEELVDEGRLVFKQFDYNGGACAVRFEYTIHPAKLAAGVAGALDMKAGAA